MGKLDGKVAAITGAGGGIGRALAKAMAAQGAAIVANDLGTTLAGDRASTSPANDVVAEIKAAGGKAAPNLMDISTMEGGKGLVDQAVKEFGKLDILVNLAGVIRDRMIFNMEEEDWDRVLDSHLKGTFCTSRFASAHMRERRYGRIINFSSNAALGSPGQPSYAAAKAGILGLTFSTAQGLRRYGITCNANDRYHPPGSISDYAQRRGAGHTVRSGQCRADRYFSRQRRWGRDKRPGVRLGRLQRDALPAHEPGENPP